MHFKSKQLSSFTETYIEINQLEIDLVTPLVSSEADKIMFTITNGIIYTGNTANLKWPILVQTGARFLWQNLYNHLLGVILIYMK